MWWCTLYTSVLVTLGYSFLGGYSVVGSYSFVGYFHLGGIIM